MIRQQIAISGLGGQGVLFMTRLLAEAALDLGQDVLASETHGMAVRGGAVMAHLKVGPFSSPLIRSGQADVTFFLAAENLAVHPHFIGSQTLVIINAPNHDQYDHLDAARLADEHLGRRQAENLVLLGYALGKGYLFAGQEAVEKAMTRMIANPKVLAGNMKALKIGLDHC